MDHIQYFDVLHNTQYKQIKQKKTLLHTDTQ